MKALRLTVVGRDLEAAEVPVRRPGPHEVLLRVRATGICRSDAHYRAGSSPVGKLPITPGHEVAGTVEEVGVEAGGLAPGARVCVHYLLTCGACPACAMGREQFCRRAAMIGKHVDGGYAEYLTVPARNAVPLPEGIPFPHGAVLMCSSATALHALRKARLQAGESVVVLGAGGLGMSALQLAKALGAGVVYALDRDAEKLRAAADLGAVPVDAGDAGALNRLRAAGIDVAVDFTGHPGILDVAVKALAPFGRLALVAIASRPFPVDTYRDLIGKEAELVGVSDHLASELAILLRFAAEGKLDLSCVVRRTIPLDPAPVNETLDLLEEGRAAVRTVIVQE